MINEPLKKTILIVDDEPDLREILAMELEDAGYRVLKAANGKEAFELVKSTPIDCVVSDVRMPGGDGVQLLEQIKAYNSKTPPVLFVTGFADIKVDEAYKKGAQAYFSKPVDFVALTQFLRDTLSFSGDKSTRQHERLPVVLQVEIKCSDGTIFHAISQNISVGGILLDLNQETLKPLDTVKLKISFPSQKYGKIETVAQIKWQSIQTHGSNQVICGAQFTTMDELTQRALILFINDVRTGHLKK